MIYVESRGRLGNQLFVIAALLRFTSDRRVRIRLVGFRDLAMLLDESDLKAKGISWASGLVERRWELISRTLSRMATIRMLQFVRVSPDNQALEYSPGAFPIAKFEGGYCQNEHLADIDGIVALWQKAAAKHANLLSSWGLEKTERKAVLTCFVHVRRGDYLQWPSPQYPAALPAEWFKQQMKKVRDSASRKVRFLVFSDDLTYARNEFGKINDAEVVDVSAEEALLLMSHCDSGVLSASTFSWWAGRLAATRSRGPFYAPRFWFGWPIETWHGEPSRADAFLEWTDVSHEKKKYKS